MKRNRLVLISILIVVGILALGYFFWPKKISEPVLDANEVIKQTLGDLDPNDPGSFFAIDAVLALGTDAIGPLTELSTSEDELEQWMATVGLAGVRGDLDNQEGVTDSLKTLSESDSVSIALRAVVSNASYGDVSGVPVLLDALENNDIMPYMDPPMSYMRYANMSLELLSGEDMGFDEAESLTDKNEAIAKWNSWWQEQQ